MIFNILPTLMSIKVFPQPFPDNIKIGERRNNLEVNYCYPMIVLYCHFDQKSIIGLLNLTKKEDQDQFLCRIVPSLSRPFTLCLLQYHHLSFQFCYPIVHKSLLCHLQYELSGCEVVFIAVWGLLYFCSFANVFSI